MPDHDFAYKGVDAAGNALRPIPYRNINLNQPLEAFDLGHDLTKKGIDKFVEDFESTIRQSVSAC
jgi:hypothetical protein